jgi:hypothetical protein
MKRGSMTKTNRPGRPALDDDGARSTQVTVRLAPKEFDTLYQRATQARVSVAEAIRRELRRGRQHDPPE